MHAAGVWRAIGDFDCDSLIVLFAHMVSVNSVSHSTPLYGIAKQSTCWRKWRFQHTFRLDDADGRWRITLSFVDMAEVISENA